MIRDFRDERRPRSLERVTVGSHTGPLIPTGRGRRIVPFSPTHGEKVPEGRMRGSPVPSAVWAIPVVSAQGPRLAPQSRHLTPDVILCPRKNGEIRGGRHGGVPAGRLNNPLQLVSRPVILTTRQTIPTLLGSKSLSSASYERSPGARRRLQPQSPTVEPLRDRAASGNRPDLGATHPGRGRQRRDASGRRRVSRG